MTNEAFSNPTDPERLDPEPARRQSGKTFRGLLLLVAGIATTLIGFAFGQNHRPEDWLERVPLSFIQQAAPVTVEIIHRPKVKYPTEEKNIALVHGPAEFVFTNYSEKPIRIAFPPVRCFHFTQNSFSPVDTLPEFAREQKTYEIPAHQSIRFEDDHGVMIPGDPSAYLQGGAGYTGFVFSRPPGATSDDDYLIGTIFPWYSVYTDDGSTDNEAMKRSAERNFRFTKRGNYGENSKPDRSTGRAKGDVRE